MEQEKPENEFSGSNVGVELIVELETHLDDTGYVGLAADVVQIRSAGADRSKQAVGRVVLRAVRNVRVRKVECLKPELRIDAVGEIEPLTGRDVSKRRVRVANVAGLKAAVGKFT